ncbi:12042_t:CDS:2 [Funneliformis caledonium]|uniref:12042_t:CDS:1 n=1 Tax=Funneliformis caledonium TaxID=1117310 RepID=A0A9N9H6C3_9GLOM|nr:12042_t:CDS:2 [Funneliformis caledonium]
MSVDVPRDIKSIHEYVNDELRRMETEHDSYLVENWDIETLIAFLKEQNLKLDDKKHYDILRKQEVTGLSFLKLTEEKLIAPPYNFPGRPALLLAEEIKALKEKPKRPFFSYKSLSEDENYRSLIVDSLENMRNEYVSTILHTSLHIARDITKKEFSMRPEYKIIGDESSGRVDYAIKV